VTPEEIAELMQALCDTGPWPQVYDTFFCNNCQSVLPDHEPDCAGRIIAELLARYQSATQLQQPGPAE
jgi:hypothetical protein